MKRIERISDVSAYEMLHRHSLTFEELKKFCQEEMKPLLEKKKLEERLRIEASYSLNHERHMQKVRGNGANAL